MLVPLTRDIPIVFYGLPDPVETGLVASLSRPSRNVTGVANFFLDVIAKRLELLAMLRPRGVRLADVFEASKLTGRISARAEASARDVGLQRVERVVPPDAPLEPVIEWLRESPPSLAMVAWPTLGNRPSERTRLVAYLRGARIPTHFPMPADVRDGALLSYGAGSGQEQAAALVARILRGERPADIPVERPRRFDLVLNLDTARAIGVEIPMAIRIGATEIVGG